MMFPLLCKVCRCLAAGILRSDDGPPAFLRSVSPFTMRLRPTIIFLVCRKRKCAHE